MKFELASPKYASLNDLDSFKFFLQKGQKEFCDFLKNFLHLDAVIIQAGEIEKIKKWLNVDELSDRVPVPNIDDQVCLFSQIREKGELIAYFPYVLSGSSVKNYNQYINFLTKLAEAVSDQITLCYLQNFTGGDLTFGEDLAKMIVANCVSNREYDGIKFAHLIEKMNQLSSATFEGESFTTGVIVHSGQSKYEGTYLNFKEPRKLDSIEKREWFLANGKETFFVLDPNANTRKIYRRTESSDSSFISRYFENYYLKNDLKTSDFIVRTVGPNEISVSDYDGKEFVKVENVWKYRHHKNITQFLVAKLGIEYKLAYAILFYTLECSRNHISSIIWIPNDSSTNAIEQLTTKNRIQIWREKLNLLNENHYEVIKKILASDGAKVVDKNGNIIYESVFADTSRSTASTSKLSGTGESATKILAQNGVAIKISQDGTIKVFSGDEKIYY